MDTTAAVAADELAHAIDYTEVAGRVNRIARDGRFRLLETLADAIASDLLQEPVARIWLQINKPAALGNARGVGVIVERTR